MSFSFANAATEHEESQQTEANGRQRGGRGLGYPPQGRRLAPDDEKCFRSKCIVAARGVCTGHVGEAKVGKIDTGEFDVCEIDICGIYGCSDQFWLVLIEVEQRVVHGLQLEIEIGSAQGGGLEGGWSRFNGLADRSGLDMGREPKEQSG